MIYWYFTKKISIIKEFNYVPLIYLKANLKYLIMCINLKMMLTLQKKNLKQYKKMIKF